MTLGVLLEKAASIETTEALGSGLETLKEMLIEVFDTATSLEDGKLLGSSGRAEAKFQSSSAVFPLLDCGCCGAGGLVEAKSNSEGDGEGAGT